MNKRDEPASGQVEAVNTFRVLAEEYDRIWPGSGRPADLGDYYGDVQARGQAALCLSGGGIRSASFALGVIQALAKKRLLTGFHYLSTVSGGGYIGGWLQRWIHEPGWSAGAVMEELGRSCRDPGAGDDADEGGREAGRERVEPQQITALRVNSNFITPRVGISSNDTWTAISISVRNIAVNWLLFAPLLLLVAVVPNLFLKTIGWVGIGAGANPYLPYIPFALALFCAIVAAWHTCRALPSYRAVNFDVPGAGDGWLNGRIVRWLIGWALLGSMVLWADMQSSEIARAAAGAGKRVAASKLPGAESWPSWLTSGGLDFAAISLAVALAALIIAGLRLPRDERDPDRDYRGAFRKDFWVWVVAFIAAALTIPVGCALFKLIPNSLTTDWGLRLFATVGPIWLMGSQLMIAFVFAAFRRNSGGPVNADADREWLARLSAVKIKQMILWGVLAFTSLLLLHMLRMQPSVANLSLTSLITVASGALAVFGGRGESTGHAAGGGAAVSILRVLPLKTVVALATFVFAAALLTIFGAFEQAIATRIGSILQPWITASGAWVNATFGWSLVEKWLDKDVLAHIALAIALALLLMRLDKRIPVNRFSLNALYRNRLARAFLGGARDKREPDPFTGFDPADNVNLSALDPKAESGTVLYPVINVALNVTAGKNLAWQERKAGPFILSPLYSGSAMLAPEPDLAREPPFRDAPSPPDEPCGVYVSSHGYGGSEPEMIQRDRGISLATAIAISGAAASPNMGYNSSAATAFLMTLFNVRLGQWMPNPARAKTLGDKVYLSNPSSSLRALLRELAGQTDDQGADIYLSDGGHFENLAVYEMIRRRCRFILVSDAGCDPNCDFADLGNLVRKVKIDLGADIIFTKMRISSRGKPIRPQFAWALGDICYGGGHTGKILYIKPSFYDHALPVDVISYAATSEAFPHESTGDQFFSESQFESYRKLGFTFADGIGGDDPGDIAAFFAAIEAQDGDFEGQDEAGFRTRMRRWLGV